MTTITHEGRAEIRSAVLTDLKHAVRLARLDLKILSRNQTAMFTVLLLPLLMGWLFTRAGEGTIAGMPLEVFVLTGLPGVLPIYAVFVNLVNSFTARREELVLRRLRGGQTSAAGIFGGAVLGGAAVQLAQTALIVAWLQAVDGPRPANIPLLLLASVLGAGVFALLAAACSGLTRTTEHAQITVLPVLLVATIGAPLFTPLSAMPPQLAIPAGLIPSTPVVELVRTAVTGADFSGGAAERLTVAGQWLAALPSLGVLVVWLLVAGLAARWLFRWDPRRG
ncbi:ABC transporter permease [Sphaerisporangium rubeum]|uniref:ABC-2 type transport system permease protein n=1 Tax=Sphaerisporangium rubeum TaxID=321317 RepID=A0A7X0IJU8_9ACTN|nr:ABC transporter permease [Sphaerisporangium rubeum]MBB6476535.1 ABC-2 type transport system permease protein [Sphaerisporangium rubeum]